jgi:hypothetical protein
MSNIHLVSWVHASKTNFSIINFNITIPKMSRLLQWYISMSFQANIKCIWFPLHHWWKPFHLGDENSKEFSTTKYAPYSLRVPLSIYGTTLTLRHCAGSKNLLIQILLGSFHLKDELCYEVCFYAVYDTDPCSNFKHLLKCSISLHHSSISIKYSNCSKTKKTNIAKHNAIVWCMKYLTAQSMTVLSLNLSQKI